MCFFLLLLFVSFFAYCCYHDGFYHSFTVTDNTDNEHLICLDFARRDLTTSFHVSHSFALSTFVAVVVFISTLS